MFLGWRLRLAKKNAEKAVHITKKIAKGTRTVLNALPTVNTEAIEKDYSGTPFKAPRETYYVERKKKKHNIADVSDDYLEHLQ